MPWISGTLRRRQQLIDDLDDNEDDDLSGSFWCSNSALTVSVVEFVRHIESPQKQYSRSACGVAVCDNRVFVHCSSLLYWFAIGQNDANGYIYHAMVCFLNFCCLLIISNNTYSFRLIRMNWLMILA